MTRTISQRELRNNNAEIMRALEAGEDFLVTRNGVPVGELRPVRRIFISRQVLRTALDIAPAIHGGRFREDVDAAIDQDVEPLA